MAETCLLKPRTWLLTGVLLALAACAPEVGSAGWCRAMEEKPKGDWSANEAMDYAKYCVLED